MARYKLEITTTAERQLKKLPRQDRRRLAQAILALADDPHPHGAKKLKGYADVLRVRVGTYRILYSVAKQELVIIILKLGHRRISTISRL